MEDGLPSLGVGERRALAWERSEGERKASVLLVLQRIGLATVEKSDNDNSSSRSVTGKSISSQKQAQKPNRHTNVSQGIIQQSQVAMQILSLN